MKSRIPEALVAIVVMACCAPRSNRVAEYLDGAEVQYETEAQRAALEAALEDALVLDAEQLSARRYPDYQGNADRWDLPTLLSRHLVPARQGMTLGNDFYRDVKATAAQKKVRAVLEKLWEAP